MAPIVHYPDTMQYRFVTPHRIGKWYPELKLAMSQAYKIGAGFYDKATGQFFRYRETELETRETVDHDDLLAA
ncbi:hypothetical protein EKN06_03220 [Croceicoccus ponticola]|uniref:Uncharacterized protein n=1 Tax=Croceicoccus ponticola TaxID=2217664 RepID=A0A437H0S3_9SPHN|nr:hypothetical protein [Croceicoccus ponticola]RVQ69225.1 hypothetical protein EKN06_03220 [Croceicoccus ponticola]